MHGAHDELILDNVRHAKRSFRESVPAAFCGHHQVHNEVHHWERHPALSSLCSTSLSPKAAVPLASPLAMFEKFVWSFF